MIDKRKFEALISTLIKSAYSGLYASLSPEDCRILLLAINSAKPRGNNWGTSVSDLIDFLSSEVMKEIDEFACEITGGPKRRRKK